MVYIAREATKSVEQRQTHRFALESVTPACLIRQYRIRSLFTPKGPQVEEILGFALGMRQDVTGIGHWTKGVWALVEQQPLMRIEHPQVSPARRRLTLNA